MMPYGSISLQDAVKRAMLQRRHTRAVVSFLLTEALTFLNEIRRHDETRWPLVGMKDEIPTLSEEQERPSKQRGSLRLSCPYSPVLAALNYLRRLGKE
jgi:hypothetical protein